MYYKLMTMYYTRGHHYLKRHTLLPIRLFIYLCHYASNSVISAIKRIMIGKQEVSVVDVGGKLQWGKTQPTCKAPGLTWDLNRGPQR